MRLRRFLALERARRGLLLEAAVGLVWTGWRLRVSSGAAMRQVRRRMQLDAHGALQDALPVAWAVRAASRHLPGSYTCLPQALVAQAMLRRRGMAAALHIGTVLEEGGALAAHAWLELDGQVLLGDVPDLARYVPLSVAPPAGGLS